MLDFLPEILRTPVAFAVVLGILVFIHELGHYLAAVACGVHVETFSIGFGQAVASWTARNGTVWRLAWIPLGGYVKLHGQEQPGDVSPETAASWMPGRTFHEKPIWKRAIVIAAGPVANMVLAAVVFILLCAVEGTPVSAPVVGAVLPDSPAAAAGLQAGDRITAIAGSEVHNFEDIQRLIGLHPAERVTLKLVRAGAPMELAVTPSEVANEAGRMGRLGVQGGPPEYRPVSPLEAVPLGLAETATVTEQTLGGVWRMLTTRHGADDLGGPLRIAQMSGRIAKLGLASLLGFIGVLSVNLALINLFPIPVLDGGHLMFYLAEALRGRPLPPRAQEIGLRAGFALLLGLFVFATWNDLGHIGVFRWVAGMIG